MSRIKSLRLKLLLAALVPGTLVLAVVAMIALFAYEREARSVLLQRDTELAKISAARLSEGLDRHRGILVDLAREPEVLAMDVAALKTAFERAQDNLLLFDGGVVVYDTDGMAVWSDLFSFERRNRAFPAPSEFEKVRQSNGSHLSDVFKDPLSSEFAILMGVPIVASGGEFMGVVAGISTLESLRRDSTYASVLEITAGREGFAYLVDGNGRVIHHRDSSQLARNLSRIAPVARVAGGETGAVITKALDGHDVISGFAPVPETSWGIITQENWSSVIGPIRGYSRLLLGLLALGGVLACGLIFLTTGRILKPIKDLTEGAQRIAGGDFDHTIEARTGDEIQALAQQFNAMAGTLKGSYAELEREVAERTEELRDSNRSLSTLIQGSPVPILAVESDTTVRMWNPAAERLLGWTEAEVVGRRLDEMLLVHEEDVGETLDYLERALRGEELLGMEMRLQQKNGDYIDTGIWTAPLRDSSGHGPGMMAVITDLTERKEAEQTLRELAVLEERNRMARDLHDTMAQGFTGIVLQLEAAEQAFDNRAADAIDHLSRAKDLARECLQEARRSVWNLLPKALEQLSLDEALSEEVDAFNAPGNGKAAFSVSGEKSELPPDIQAALLRICQESLTNVRKHSGATEVNVELEFQPDDVSLSVEDNGKGYESNGDGSRPGHGGFGLIGMEQRVLLLRGSFQVDTAIGKGTRVTVKIPTVWRSRGQHPF